MRIPREQLVSRVVGMQNGNPADFEYIYDVFWEHACLTVKKYGGKECDVEDIVQDAFVSVYKNIRQLAAPEAFLGWLNKILLNCVRKAYRKNTPVLAGDNALASTSETPELSERIHPEICFERGERLRAVLAAVEELPKKQKYAFINHYFYGKKIKEVARAQGVSEGAVKNALYNARASLGKKIKIIW